MGVCTTYRYSSLLGFQGEQSITLRADTVARERNRPAVKMLVGEEDAPLLSALKAKRRALAEAAGLPAYMVFNDRTLVEMAQSKPSNMDAMAQVNGVGAAKLERYGATFVEVITGAAPAAVHPARRALAGTDAASLYDLLEDAVRDLSRGDCGTLKPMDCKRSSLRHIAERRPASLPELARIPGMDDRKTERFGARFLDIIAQA